MRVHLKVKIKTLAAESRIIRHQELRFKEKPRLVPPDASVAEKRLARKRRRNLSDRQRAVRSSLHFHRTIVVRREARASLLAYGFLRGRTYKAMEATCREKPPWKRIEELVKRFGDDDLRDRMQRFSEWKDAAAA